jgi:hypothetical protein
MIIFFAGPKIYDNIIHNSINERIGNFLYKLDNDKSVDDLVVDAK